MKKLNLTWIIIISGIAAAACMLVNAFAPALYKSLASTVFCFAMLGLALVAAPEVKVTWKWFGSLVGIFAVLAGIAFGFEKLGLTFLRIPVFATLAALGMILCKEKAYALPAALAAAAIAQYSAGSFQTFCILGVAFALISAAFEARKIKSVPLKIAAAFIICLALCAFK